MPQKNGITWGNSAPGNIFKGYTMSTTSRLQASIKLLHGDKGATLASLTASFREDYSHFATANNREALNMAVSELKKSPKDKAISEAISEAYKAGNLTVGYIGARTGKFSVQPEDIQATFNGAINKACEAFNSILESCEAFADKAPKTQAEKDKAKEDKAAKAKEATEATINAMIQAGEIVRACDVKKLEDMGQTALIDALVLLGVDVVAMQAAYAALTAEHAAMQTPKKAKAKALA